MTLDRMLRADQPDHSPCVGHCTFDAGGYCLSCRRHEDEKAGWKEGSEADRSGIWNRLPSAIDEAGRDLMRLPLAPEDIMGIADEVLGNGGAWVAGYGDHWYSATRRVAGAGHAARTESGERITLNLAGPDVPGKVRALAWAGDGKKLSDGLQALPLVLVVPVARLAFPVNGEPTWLDDGRMDLGLGLASVRLLEDGKDVTIETPIAKIEGVKIDRRITPAAAEGNSSTTPEGLVLNESYAFGAMLVPGGVEPPPGLLK